MAELNLKQIVDKLNTEFTGNIVSWYSGMTIKAISQRILTA